MSESRRPPALFAPVLALLQADAALHFRATNVQLVPRAYQERPASHILRVDVLRPEDQSLVGRLFVKVFKPRELPGGPNAMADRVVHDYETTCRVHAWMSEHGDLGVVPPVACYPEHLTIVTEEVEGPTLLDYLKKHTSWLGTRDSDATMTATMERVGRWLRVFQGLDARPASITVDTLKAYIDHRLQRLVREPAAGFTERDRQGVLTHIDALGSQIGENELDEVPVHADMALGNLLVTGSRIVVLDFAMTKRGSSLLDLTRLFVQMDLLTVKPHVHRALVERLQEAMVAGFDSRLTKELPLFRLLLLLHRVNHLATLSVNRAPFLEGLYNNRVKKRHRQWLAAELRRDALPGTSVQ